jgi:pyruvate ferredoxin oxidoreductase delta subunit
MMTKELKEGAIVIEAGSSKQNKTGSWRTFRPVVTDKCIGCKICEWYCPDSAIKVKESGGKKKAEVDYDYCKGCLICVGACPSKAITSEKER